MFALYIGYAASNLTTSLAESQLAGIEDLPGKAVGTWGKYTDLLRKYGVEAVAYPWESDADEQYMVEQLKSGAVRALVLDTPVAAYRGATDCQLTVVGSPFAVRERVTVSIAVAPSRSWAGY